MSDSKHTIYECVRECETCDGPLPPLDEWSMPSCPECVKLADERNELIAELENISSYEAGAAQDIIKRAIAALRDDHLRSLRDGAAEPPEVCRERTPCDGLVEIAETDAHVILQCPRCGGCVNVQKERIHEITKGASNAPR